MPLRLKQFAICAALAAMFAASPITLSSQEVVMQKAMSLDLAHAIAQAALDNCRAHNYHIAIVVIDAAGVVKVLLRDDGSGPQNADTARRKAFTALAFKGNSSDQVKIWETQKIPNISPDRVALAGGVAIKAGNDVRRHRHCRSHGQRQRRSLRHGRCCEIRRQAKVAIGKFAPP